MPEENPSRNCKRSLPVNCGCCLHGSRGFCSSVFWGQFWVYVGKLNVSKIVLLCALLFCVLITEDIMLQERDKSAERRHDELNNIGLTKQRSISIEEQGGTVLEGYIKRVIDGDTVRLTFENMPFVFRDISCRLRGIDAPELRRSRCCVEKCLAKIAKEYVEKLHPIGSVVTIVSPKKGKYFRIIANLTSSGRDTADLLFRAGLAVRYAGSGARFDWCGVPKIKKVADTIGKNCRICEQSKFNML